jgi:hypothetical protein
METLPGGWNALLRAQTHPPTGPAIFPAEKRKMKIIMKPDDEKISASFR